MAENILLQIVTAIITGIILLIIEYRTSWFQKHLSNLLGGKGEAPEEISSVSAPQALEILGKSVTPVDALPSPTGDWLQIAREVQTILEEIYCQNVKRGNYYPRVELVQVSPIKKSKACKLTFDMTTNYQEGIGYVTVDTSGKIVEFTFEY